VVVVVVVVVHAVSDGMPFIPSYLSSSSLSIIPIHHIITF
jgi:hypothetical protein